ncbi:MAG: tetratricopeptide repeat protein [Bacteroidota bacterium]|nr:tetratricopeptide repeat protein [Bacteroidota bacterium]
MRKSIITVMTVFLMLSFTFQGLSQQKKMTWTTKSKQANELALSGAHHMMNVELEQAYADFSAALKLDPNFTQPLVFMANINRGATAKSYAERAQKSAVNKTAGEKLFASLTGEKTTADERRDIWAKLHAMFPDGEMLGFYYVQTRATPEERFAAAEDFAKQFPNNAPIHNVIGYLYMLDKKDTDKAKENLEKYIALYPEGTNPYDSMGEYYLNTGDTDNAKKYYTMALEKYPLNNSSLNALQKMADDKKTSDSK